MNSSPQQSGIPIILITGFGSFRSVLKNPSWEVAQALKTYAEWTRPLHIITHQLQVTYDDVSKKIPDYWIDYNPTLVVHIGVAKGSKEIRMEKYACNTNYCHTDNNGSVPETEQCVKNDAPKVLMAQLPLSDICSRTRRRTHLTIVVSDNAGRYLCEYIYYQSLFIDSKRTILIHIPDLDKKFTVENLADTIQIIIYEALRYVPPLPVVNQPRNYLIQTNMIVNNFEKLNLNRLS
ncbi:unnamed protein product [Adineta ricciae]|uniref:Pyroglutamyl-peptidase 1 n=1 Tax=Adineta ricciae TaxID=249248 RepID=A0A814YU65_ADIRI|nr:unnamed protein product [Adineta ricciae]CAF1233358.1 unnamed protein product [Adineta ricciae]